MYDFCLDEGQLGRYIVFSSELIFPRKLSRKKHLVFCRKISCGKVQHVILSRYFMRSERVELSLQLRKFC